MIFELEDSNTGKVYSFEMNCTQEQFEEWVDTQDFPVPYKGRTLTGNHYGDFVGEMEQHGVLDVNGGDEVEGYVSYEIAEEMYPKILEEFRVYFVKEGLV